MSATMAIAGNTADTFLVHFFGTGLADERYVVERFRARADDEIVPEPLGGAHRDVDSVCQTMAQTLHTQLSQLLATSTEQLLANRHEKFRQMAALADV